MRIPIETIEKTILYWDTDEHQFEWQQDGDWLDSGDYAYALQEIRKYTASRRKFDWERFVIFRFVVRGEQRIQTVTVDTVWLAWDDISAKMAASWSLTYPTAASGYVNWSFDGLSDGVMYNRFPYSDELLEAAQNIRYEFERREERLSRWLFREVKKLSG